MLGEPKEILRFLDYHLGLQGAGEYHRSAITSALEVIIVGLRGRRANRLTAECTKKLNCASPSFARGVRSILHPDGPVELRGKATNLVGLISDQWFNSTVPIMKPGEVSEFSEHVTMFVIDEVAHTPLIQKGGVAILFGMLRSSEWRNLII